MNVGNSPPSWAIGTARPSWSSSASATSDVATRGITSKASAQNPAITGAANTLGQVAVGSIASARKSAPTEIVKKNPPDVFISPTGEVCVMRTAAPVRRLVLQGGGVKGITAPTYLKQFNETFQAGDKSKDLIHSLEEVSGTSSGSIMAFALAAGVPLEQIEETLAEKNLLQQLRGDFKPHELFTSSSLGALSAGNLSNTLLELTSKEATTELPVRSPSNRIATGKKLAEFKKNLMENQGERFDEVAFKKFETNVASGFKDGLTFKDLEFLHEFKPEKFKLLHINGFNRTTKQAEYFNAAKTPDLPCHIAMRMSVSIPGLIKPLKNEKGERISDGAEATNILLAGFKEKRETETLIMHFGKEGKGQTLLGDQLSDSSSIAERILKGTLKKIADTVVGSHFMEGQIKDAKAIGAHGPNALAVPFGDLKVASFAAGKKTVKIATDAATQAAIKAANARASGQTWTYEGVQPGNGQAAQTSVAQALKSLSREEIEALKPNCEEKIKAAEAKLSIFERVIADEKKMLRIKTANNVNGNATREHIKASESNIRAAKAEIAFYKGVQNNGWPPTEEVMINGKKVTKEMEEFCVKYGDGNIADMKGAIAKGEDLASRLSNAKDAEEAKKIGHELQLADEGPKSVSNLMWFLMARAAAQDELYTSGAMRLDDPGRKVEAFLRACGGGDVYPRISTHMKENLKGASQSGLDLRNEGLPAKKNTLLFAGQNDDPPTLFLKMEESGCPPFWKKEFRSFHNFTEFARHTADFISTRFADPADGMEAKKKEHVPKAVQKEFEATVRVVGSSLNNQKDDVEALIKKGNTKGLSEMSKILEGKNDPIVKDFREKNLAVIDKARARGYEGDVKGEEVVLSAYAVAKDVDKPTPKWQTTKPSTKLE